MTMRWPIALAFAALAALAARSASAGTAMFAVIAGVNTSVDGDLPALRYADDDAVLYQDLFRQLGATTVLLARLDDNTRRLHGLAAAVARPPRRAELERAIAGTAAAVTEARARGQTTAFYFVYAGHGNVRDGQGYIGLEDDRLTAAELERRIIDAVPADQIHVIIDACYSGLLAGTRGPGGERRPLHGFSRFQGLADDDRIGLLLSTSSARESHEWEGFQAGVFSYEVRSGMYGAADADGDGQVSYLEIAAFVSRANAAIPNERFRPDVYARPPRGGRVLVDLREAQRRRLEIEGSEAGHYVLEDERGVRVMDFHNGTQQKVAVVRPASPGDLFLRRFDDNREYRVALDAPEVVTFDQLVATEPHVTARGAVDASFNLTFSLQFDEDVVRRFDLPSRDTAIPRDGAQRTWRRPAAWASLGVGLGAAGVSIGFAVSARRLRDGTTPDESQAGAAERNARISSRNAAAAICAGVAAAGAVTAAVLLLWPDAHRRSVVGTVQPATGGALLAVSGTF